MASPPTRHLLGTDTLRGGGVRRRAGGIHRGVGGGGGDEVGKGGGIRAVKLRTMGARQVNDDYIGRGIPHRR